MQLVYVHTKHDVNKKKSLRNTSDKTKFTNFSKKKKKKKKTYKAIFTFVQHDECKIDFNALVFLSVQE